MHKLRGFSDHRGNIITKSGYLIDDYKVKGEDNPGDIFTKASLTHHRIKTLLEALGCVYREGRAESAPALRHKGGDRKVLEVERRPRWSDENEAEQRAAAERDIINQAGHFPDFTLNRLVKLALEAATVQGRKTAAGVLIGVVFMGGSQVNIYLELGVAEHQQVEPKLWQVCVNHPQYAMLFRAAT